MSNNMAACDSHVNKHGGFEPGCACAAFTESAAARNVMRLCISWDDEQ